MSGSSGTRTLSVDPLGLVWRGLCPAHLTVVFFECSTEVKEKSKIAAVHSLKQPIKPKF